jgi:hypothetical protein
MLRRQLLALAGTSLTVTAALAQPAAPSPQKFPDVVAAKVRASGVDTFDFDVTVSSTYDTPQRYADAFRVKGKDGVVYGERVLRTVMVQARDQRFGYGGKTIDVVLPGR